MKESTRSTLRRSQRRKKTYFCQETILASFLLSVCGTDSRCAQSPLCALTACMAVALGPKDDVVWSQHPAHPVNHLHSLQGKGLSQDLKQVNVLHDYVGHPSIVMGEVVDLWHTHIALGEVGQVVQHHNLGVEGQVCAKLDGVLAKWEAASVVAVIPILVLMLGTGAHDG